MQLSSDVQIPDGLLAANVLLSEKPRLGFRSDDSTLRWGSSVVISSTAIGISGTLYDSRIESRYTGKERDAESGLDYFGARYYASSMGRFMSPDPSQLAFADPTNPQSFNLYSYAVNNPLKFADPTGLWHCVWNSATGDQDDTHENGGASEQDCSGQGGAWTIDDGDALPDSSLTIQGDSEHPGWDDIASSVCTAIPTAGVQGVSGAMGGISGPAGSLEIVTNYRTGQVSGFGAGGISVGWNGGATGAAFSGGVWGLQGNNSNYSGGFTSVTASGSIPVPFVGLQGTLSGSSGGLTGTPSQMMPDGQVKSLTFGPNLSLVSPRYSATAAVTNYSAPKQLGKYWTLAFSPLDQLLFLANQTCAAAGH